MGIEIARKKKVKKKKKQPEQNANLSQTLEPDIKTMLNKFPSLA